MKKRNKSYALIPSVNALLEKFNPSPITREALTRLIRDEVALYKKNILGSSREAVESELVTNIQLRLERLLRPSLKKVINATGIILHTGLGRAPFSEDAKQSLARVVDRYCSIEMDLDSGERGERTGHVEELLCLLTGAEAAAVVNNNAAATLLLLNALAFQKEVIISRGELVEIGGSFRIPEIMEKSGVVMKETGTTNKTHLRDYEKAITARTGLLLKVHTSNYRVLGFTQSVSLADLVTLGRKKKIPVAHDLGGGVLANLENFGLPHEPVVQDSITAGADVVAFSGDKILGACQAGILVGKKKFISLIRKNPLMRAMRCDKMTYAVLEATLKQFLRGDVKQSPVLHMLTESKEQVRLRAETLQRLLAHLPMSMEVVDSEAQTGSGALPLEKIPSAALKLRPQTLGVPALAHALRMAEIPVLGYVRNQALWLDMRTVTDEEVHAIAAAISKIIGV